MAATFADFTRANDLAAATSSKLQKQAILAEYMRSLDETDLRLAVRFASGQTFASTDERVLNVGGALVSDVILTSLKLDPQTFHNSIVRTGDIGEAIAGIWPACTSGMPMLLADVGRQFDALASTRSGAEKRELLAELFSRCLTGREAAYLTKIIFGDMRTGIQEGVLRAAIALAFGRKLADVQKAQLMVGDLDEVAILARRDELSAAVFRLFHPIQFMLAAPQEDAEQVAKTLAGRTFWAEDKLDGIRAQIHKSGDGAAARVEIFTRTMDRTDTSFPDVVASITPISGDFLLDGEIVPYRDGVVLPFAHIQKRLGRKTLPARVLRENPCAFIAFDVLYRDGELLMNRPLRDRRKALETIAAITTQPIELSNATEVASAFDAARLRRNEGIVLKDPDSPYSPGRRGKAWLKLKTHLPTFDCVVTAAEYGHGKRRNWISDYTFAVWDGSRLVNIGKAYSGVTDEEIMQLTELFLKLSIVQHGRMHIVQPHVVLEIACDAIQKSARHASGYALRFPRIKRIRWDKQPSDADRLERIAELYEGTHNFARPKDPAVESPEPTLFDGV